MYIEVLIVLFLYIIISYLSTHPTFRPLREGNTNQECSEALKLSKKNAGNLSYVDDELKRLDTLAKNMTTLDGKVEQNAQSLASISKRNEEKAKQLESSAGM